jgi:hypothetical protein
MAEPFGAVADPGGGTIARMLDARLRVEVAPWRWLGAGMVALGAALPHVAHNPGLPCPLRSLTGVPCPLCGMTTSVKATCNGHLAAAVAANPFGLVAVLVALLLVVRPRWQALRVRVAPLIALGALSWAWELHRFHWL